MSFNIPRLVISGTGSSAGKTTSSLALAKCFQNKGLTVQTFKCGPDYLDPTYLERVTGRPCHNLDGWMMGKDAVLATFARACKGADIAIIEGMMGLFDGASPDSEIGSTAEIAKWLKAPVILMIDASGMARTIAAHAQGFKEYDPALNVAGIIANKVGSRGHLDLLRESKPAIPVVGGFPKCPDLVFPSRHLGLVTASKKTVKDELIDRWAELASEWFEIDTICDLAKACGNLTEVVGTESRDVKVKCKIGIANDDAFHFYYDDNLARLKAAGAELVEYSPKDDATVPDVAGLYFGGGYPETIAKELSSNKSMLESIRAFAEKGGPIYAECGGLMYLTSGIRTLENEFYPLVGLIPGECRMFENLKSLGYVETKTTTDTLLGRAGTTFKGHQFRYSEIEAIPDDFGRCYELTRRRDGEVTPEGYFVNNVLASYVHAHWASNPEIPISFVSSCVAWQGC